MNNTTNGEGAEWEVIDERIRFGFYIIFLVIGSVGNMMLIGIIARKKSSKTVFELFVLNLAVSDLLLILLYIGPSVYSFIAEFSASLFYCKFLWPISTFAFLLEIFSMISMHGDTSPLAHSLLPKAQAKEESGLCMDRGTLGHCFCRYPPPDTSESGH